MNYSELSSVLMEEKRSPQLQTLNTNFFDEIERLTEEYEKRIKQDKDFDSERAFRNLQKKFNELQFVRTKKVFLQALADFQLNKTSFEGMSDNEQKLYVSLVDQLKKFLNRQPQPSTLKLKLLAEIPKFIGLSGKEYGPFEKGSVADIEFKDANILLARNVAENTV